MPVACLSLLAACGEGDEPASPSSKTDAGLRALDDLSAIEFESSWDPATDIENPTAGLQPLLAADFEDDLGPFRVHCEAGPLVPAEAAPVRLIEVPAGPALDAEAPLEGARSLRFPTRAGAVWTATSVRPDTHHRFEALVGRHGAAAAAPEGSLVGDALLIELRREPDPEQPPMIAVAAAGVVARHHLHPDARGRLELAWRTSVFTRAVVLVLVAGDPGWWLARSDTARPPPGTVSFDAARLHEIPLRRALAQELGGAAESALCRRVAVGGDRRRALLCPAPSRWTLPLHWPGGRTRVEFSYAMLEEPRAGWGVRPTGLRASISGEGWAHDLPLPRAQLAPGSTLQDSGWHEARHVLDLPAGEMRLCFEIEAEGPSLDVAVVAEPRLVSIDEADERLSVLLISLDTLRADHLGCYGYRREDGEAVSPRLDAFASECLLFERAYATAPYTLPSHATMLTGHYPSAHGVTDKNRRIVSGLHPLIAERLAEAGYATAGFTAGGYVSYDFGFDAGFDRYSILDPLLDSEDRFRLRFPHHGQRERNDLLFARCDWRAFERWTATREGLPFFAFLHTYVVHNYQPPATFRERFVGASRSESLNSLDLQQVDLEYGRREEGPPAELVADLVDLYDATIAAADQQLGELFDALRSSGRLDHTVVVLTSDHGEEFGEHGGLVHGRSLYEEMQHVPLLIRWPGERAGRVREPVDLSDLFATLLDAAGMEAAGPGVSLRRRVREGEFAETIWHEVRARNQAEIYALQRWPYKLIHTPAESDVIDPDKRLAAPEWQLFELEQDRREAVELLAERADDPEVARRFRRLREEMTDLRRELDSEQTRLFGDHEPPGAELSDAMKQQLNNLGYSVDD